MAAAAPFANVYTHRRVAESSARSCDVCYKPSSSVLVTPDKLDFFYICPNHLKDRGFCTPIVDEAAEAAKRKKKEMEDEVERVKKEYAEKQKKKLEKAKEEKEKEGKDKDKKEEEGEKKEEEDKEKKDDAKDKDDEKPASPKVEEEEPRVFALQRTFYQLRLDKKRQADIDRRNLERMQNPNFFPSVPKNLP